MLIFNYECRKCNKIIDSGMDAFKENNRLMEEVEVQFIPYTSNPTPQIYHECNEYEIGICDLIGFKRNEL